MTMIMVMSTMTMIMAMVTAMANTIPTSGSIRFALLSRSKTSETAWSKLTPVAPMDTRRTRRNTPPNSKS